MTYLEMAQLAKRYGAVVATNVTFTKCRAQRRYKYGCHAIYQPGMKSMKSRPTWSIL